MSNLIREKKETGFTLIEVAVTAAILVFLMSVAWSSNLFRAGDFSLMMTQEKLRLLLTRAKSLTLGGVSGEGTDICGYGVMVEEGRAFIFSDNGTCERGVSDESNRRYDPGEELSSSLDSIQLSEGIVFLPSSGSTTQVVFVPPYLLTVINGEEGLAETEIEVMSPSGLSRKVMINNQGLINLGR
jgi:type II secretory pathway pseudopilin PulG